MPTNAETDIERAIVVSYNWLTQEILFTDFDGPDAAGQAEGWAHRQSFIWRDFPPEDGWTHFAHWNKLAGKAHGEKMVNELTEHGTISVMVPK
ncbi:MAG: hypothetical protein JSS66_06480 [Armatimonadetes bacterium]|nr:hypothetical protein [Armatimonadota bacterium]